MTTYLPDKRTIGIKIESTPYTAETLAAEDYNVEAFDITLSPEIQEYVRKIARGDMDYEPSVMGQKQGTVSFKVAIAEASTSIQTPPTFGKCLRSCGKKETIFGTSGVSYVPNSEYTNVPVTIEVPEMGEGIDPIQMLVKFKGCMGKPKLVMTKVGEPGIIEFEYLGALVDITDRANVDLLVPTGMIDNAPEAILSMSMTVFGESRNIGSLTIDIGNDVQLYSTTDDSSGFTGAHVVKRESMAEMDPDLDSIANQGDYARWVAGTTGAFAIDIGSNIHLSSPAAQIIDDYKFVEREGHTAKNQKLRLTRGPAGEDCFKYLQGAES